jgi:hypothetical protein
MPTDAEPSPPNIVFIMADDLGYADVGCYGRCDLSTPNIDSIAERGVQLRQAYANSAVCSATRLALITGRYQYRLPLGLEEPLAGNTDVGLPPEHPTLPSLLREAGYWTSLVGKWHLGMPPKFGPTLSGYNRFFGIRSGAVDYYTHENPRGQHDLWNGDEPFRQKGYMTVRQHHRHFHQRQWRRAILSYLAVHRHKDRVAGGWAAYSRADLLAGADSRRSYHRSGDDHDGLVPDAAGGGGHRTASRLSARRDRSAAAVDRTRRAGASPVILALQDRSAARDA